MPEDIEFMCPYCENLQSDGLGRVSELYKTKCSTCGKVYFTRLLVVRSANSLQTSERHEVYIHGTYLTGDEDLIAYAASDAELVGLCPGNLISLAYFANGAGSSQEMGAIINHTINVFWRIGDPPTRSIPDSGTQGLQELLV